MSMYLFAAQDAGGGGAFLGFLIICGVLCAIFSSVNKKKTYDVRGTVRER